MPTETEKKLCQKEPIISEGQENKKGDDNNEEKDLCCISS